jgi:hypothetical protein
MESLDHGLSGKFKLRQRVARMGASRKGTIAIA